MTIIKKGIIEAIILDSEEYKHSQIEYKDARNDGGLEISVWSTGMESFAATSLIATLDNLANCVLVYNHKEKRIELNIL